MVAPFYAQISKQLESPAVSQAEGTKSSKDPAPSNLDCSARFSSRELETAKTSERPTKAGLDKPSHGQERGLSSAEPKFASRCPRPDIHQQVRLDAKNLESRGLFQYEKMWQRIPAKTSAGTNVPRLTICKADQVQPQIQIARLSKSQVR